MTIGNPDSFGVLFEIGRPMTEWMFGKFSYIVRGSVIGNYSDGCSLRSAVGAMRRVSGYAGQRASPELMILNTEEVFQQINDALYVDFGQSGAQVVQDRSNFWRLQVKDIGFDVFDGWKCYLIEDDKVGRLIWCDERAGAHPIEARLTAGEFDLVINDFVKHIAMNHLV